MEQKYLKGSKEMRTAFDHANFTSITALSFWNACSSLAVYTEPGYQVISVLLYMVRLSVLLWMVFNGVWNVTKN